MYQRQCLTQVIALSILHCLNLPIGLGTILIQHVELRHLHCLPILVSPILILQWW